MFVFKNVKSYLRSQSDLRKYKKPFTYIFGVVRKFIDLINLIHYSEKKNYNP